MSERSIKTLPWPSSGTSQSWGDEPGVFGPGSLEEFDVEVVWEEQAYKCEQRVSSRW